MQVNEEIDALETLGISPVDFPCAPAVLFALTLMVPLLTIYADFMGIIGGFIVGTLMLGLNPMEYLVMPHSKMVPYRQMLIGLVYERFSALSLPWQAVIRACVAAGARWLWGQTTTKAVVSSIVGIIVMTAIITVICNVLDV